METVWKPPEYHQFEFSRNCTMYGIWLSAYNSPDPWHAELGWALGVNLYRSMVLLYQSLPQGWSHPTPAQAAKWWADVYFPGFDPGYCPPWPVRDTPCYLWQENMKVLIPHLFDKPGSICRPEVCKAMARTGNPDLAGIGVIVAYFFEAVLVTLFFIAFATDSVLHKRWHRKDDHLTSSKTANLISVFQKTVKCFFESAAFLTIAMLIAALYTTSITTDSRKRLLQTQAYIAVLSNFYDVKMALLSSLFCIFPVGILSMLNEQTRAKRLQRTLLIIVAYVLCVVLVFKSPNAEWDSGVQNLITISCDLRGGKTYWAGLEALKWLVLVIPFLWAVANALIMNSLDIGALERVEALTKWREAWPLITGAGGLVAMWTFLGCFIKLRGDIIGAAKEMDRSGELGFGQVLALFAWAPVVWAFAGNLFARSGGASEKRSRGEYADGRQMESSGDLERLV